MRQMTLLAVCAIVCLSSVVTMAQTPEPSMVRLIPDLLRDAALIDKGPTAVDQSAHFQLGLQSMRAPDELNRALAWELASFPMGPTSGDVVFSKGATGTEGPRAFGSGYGQRSPVR